LILPIRVALLWGLPQLTETLSALTRNSSLRKADTICSLVGHVLGLIGVHSWGIWKVFSLLLVWHRCTRHGAKPEQMTPQISIGVGHSQRQELCWRIRTATAASNLTMSSWTHLILRSASCAIYTTRKVSATQFLSCGIRKLPRLSTTKAPSWSRS